MIERHLPRLPKRRMAKSKMANNSNPAHRPKVEKTRCPPVLHEVAENLLETTITQHLAIPGLQHLWAGQDRTVGHTIFLLDQTYPFLHTTLQTGSTNPAATIGEMVEIVVNNVGGTPGINAIIVILVKRTMVEVDETRDKGLRLNVLSETVIMIDAPTTTTEEVSHPADLEGQIRRGAETQETVVLAIDRKKEQPHRQLRKLHRQNRVGP